MNQFLQHRQWIAISVLTLLLLGLVALIGANWRSNDEQAPLESAGGRNLPAQSAATTPVSAAATAAQNDPDASGAQQAPTGTPTPDPTPTSTPQPAERLQEASRLHRYGYYTDEQWMLLALLAEPALSAQDQHRTRFQLAESYLADDQFAQALATLDQLQTATETRPAEEAASSRLIFLRGEALAGLGRYDEAVTAYNAFLEAHPALVKPLSQILGETYESAGNPAAAAQAFQRAADAATDNSERARLLEAVAANWQTAGRWAEAAAALDAILSFAVQPAYRTGVARRAGDAHAQAGNLDAAVARWQTSIDEYYANRNMPPRRNEAGFVVESAPDPQAAYQSLIELVNRGVPVDNYVRGVVDVAAEAYLPAIGAFEAFLAEASPDDPQAGAAWLGIGRAHLGLGNWAEAQAALTRVIEEYPSCDCFGEAWLEQARLEILRGDDTAGRRIYRTFAREHPEDPSAPEALWRSALSAVAADNQLEAAVDFLSLADAFPGSERAPRALYVLGIGAMTNGFHAQAADSFHRLRDNYPDHEWQAASYWLGRALTAQGNVEQAREEWQSLVEREPDTYYGVLAGLALQRDGDYGRNIFDGVDRLPNPVSTLAGDDGSQAFAERWLAEWAGVPVDQLGALPPEVATDPDLQNGELMLSLDRRSEALSLLDQVYRRYRDDLPTLYALVLHFEDLHTYGLSVQGVSHLLAQSPAALTEDAPIFLQRIAYPRHFSELVEEQASAHDLDPLLFYSLIRQESIFEEGARSYAAAQGLAQIIPSTGAEIAERIGYPNYRNDLIYRPHINVRFGTFYLDWVRDFVGGDSIAPALAGYNAGPGNAQRWRERSGPDDTLFVELMDFSEPRLYIERILSHYYHYNRLY